MSETSIRKDFEAFIAKRDGYYVDAITNQPFSRMPDGRYFVDYFEKEWQVWNAARASFGVEQLAKVSLADIEAVLDAVCAAHEAMGMGRKMSTMVKSPKELKATLLGAIRRYAVSAARWDALLGCARIRILGTAGLTLEGRRREDRKHVHFGAEFWTHHDAGQEEHARVVLTSFADAAIDAKGEKF